jgi:hypothetical protein
LGSALPTLKIQAQMAKDDQQEAYEKLLCSSLSRVIDFVKFAEAKNAAMLTFSSAWIIASVSLLFGPSRLTSDSWQMAFSIALPCFIISGIISIFSLIPRISLSSFYKDPERRKALLYFGDAAEYSADKFANIIKERYFPLENHSATTFYLDDLAIQINVNSVIAARKFRRFYCGATITILALLVLSVPAISAIWRSASPHLAGLSKLWQ